MCATYVASLASQSLTISKVVHAAACCINQSIIGPLHPGFQVGESGRTLAIKPVRL